jgi:hypothetical protein
MKIIIGIVGSLIKSNKSFKKILGIIITISICGLGIWIILIFIAISEPRDI